jgi:hypothetical protein
MRRGANVAVLGMALLLALCALAATGCAPSKEEAAATLAAQQKQECLANQKRIKLATDLVNADTGIYPDIASVVQQLRAVCPAGGAYSFDATTDTVSCTVHGSQ